MQFTSCYHAPNDWFTLDEVKGTWIDKGSQPPYPKRCLQVKSMYMGIPAVNALKKCSLLLML